MEAFGTFLPLILIFVVFYFLLIRPQQKKVKQHKEMLSNLKRGDKIVTSGGIIGTINKVADNRELTLEVAENVEIKIASGMVADLYAMPEVQKKEPPKEENKSKSGFSLFSRKNNFFINEKLSHLEIIYCNIISFIGNNFCNSFNYL